ncbi:MAG: response regulator [Thermodesulfovibrionales bacterium]
MEKKDFRILVADDDEIARDVITSLLQREGYSVAAALDGLDAIRILRIEEIGLVITDLRMPGADGIEVLKYAVRTNPDIAVVILTAYGTLDTTLEAIKEGAYDYLTKPFKGQEIILVADRAFRLMTLVNENKELTRHIRDTHRDMEALKKVAAGGNPEVTTNWLERVARLNAMGVLTGTEVQILKERLIKGDDKGNSPHS